MAAGAHCRRFSTTAFLPFEEARNWARSLGLCSVREWKALKSARPSNIPCNPNQTYAEQFTSYYDWLGYSKRRPRQGISQTPLAADVTLRSIHESGIDRIVSGAKHSLEFLRMPKGSSVPLLFRPAGSRTHWCALHFRTTKHVRRYGGADYSVFHKLGKCRGAPLVCADDLNDRLYIFGRDVLKTSTNLYVSAPSRPGKHDKFLLDPSEVPQRLREIYDAGPLRTEQGWAEWASESGGKAKANPYAVNHISLRTLDSVLFAPSGISFAAAQSSLDLHNIVLDGRPALLRIAFPRQESHLPHRPRMANMVKVIDNRDHPFDSEDKIDFYLIANRDDDGQKLRGCFVFPRKVLREQEVLSTVDFLGVQTLSLYPPETTLTPRNRRRIVSVQNWQLPYYIDLSTDEEEAMEQGRESFKKILRNSLVT